MKLEDQVTSLELSKKLKELGVEQESLWCWVCKRGRKWTSEEDHWFLHETESSYNYKGNDKCSAFTVAELGEMLPNNINENFRIYHLKLRNYGDSFGIAYELDNDEEDNWMLHDEIETTEANARAKMLIYLIENKLIELKENQ